VRIGTLVTFRQELNEMTFLTVRLLRVEVFVVLVFAVFGVTLITLYQLHINEDRLKAFEASLKVRQTINASLVQQQRQQSSLRDSLLDSTAHLESLMRRIPTSGVPSTDGVGPNSVPCPPSKETPNGHGVDKQGEPNEGDFDIPIVTAAQVGTGDWLDELAELLDLKAIEESIGKRDTVNSQENEFRSALIEAQELLRDREAMLKHQELKFQEISKLWLKWFTKEGKPIYKGLFAADAAVHPSHEEGLALHKKYNTPRGNGRGGGGD
jgi:hypothetical protein